MVVYMGEHLDYDIWEEDQYEKYVSYIQKDVESILDVGCGRGEWLSLLKKKGLDTYGCDTDDKCIRKSRKFGSVKKADILNLEDIYKTNQFDMVTALHILEHVTCPLKGLEQIKKVSKKYCSNRCT
jgi:2-polyprenyl-3-methyl-5-hydroxy-6-metoxy-1,4-benzoquinol methylase